MDDSEIIELYFLRDEQAIDETDKKYGKLCLNIAKNVLGNNYDAEECVNDTYLSIWNVIPPTRPNRFAAFISKIVRNLSIKRLDYNLANKRSRYLTVSFAELECVLSSDCIESKIEQEEIAKKISAFLWEEKEDARNVFIRRYYFFDSIGDIAEKYSYTESKVKNMLYRSRERLKAYLKNEGVEL